MEMQDPAGWDRPVLMADSVDPAAVHDWAGPVLAYRDGRYRWPEQEIIRHREVIGISVTGDPAMTGVARELDVERGDASPSAAPAWYDARLARGHRDATIYCDRANTGAVMAALAGRPARLHIATLDAVPWHPLQLAADLYARWGADVTPAMIWAIQCYPASPGRPRDVSLVYGRRDFWDPARQG